ncbi:hypothetical protein [Geotalea toluenoxydans]|uniref:hypothetical protein n=1 Tax=Geotalea toluenoxydans TaxID=421624 RepID=UPI0006D20833|nr:hypothetical protein [Geotalea toluenoxydans]
MCDVSVATSYTPYITAIGGAITGGAISLFVGFKLSQRNHTNALALMKRQEANKAFLALEASFLPALRILKRTGTKDFDKIPTFFDNQEIAMLSFVWHLSGENRTGFEEKWAKYKEWQKEYEERENQMENFGLMLMCDGKRPGFIKILEDIIEAAKKY